ncbi:MAG: tryptophan synthase subunit alpha, partial [Candidatus Binatia bacterium]
MSRIKKVFAELKKRGEAALIPFITAGDPDLDTTLKIMLALDAGGA